MAAEALPVRGYLLHLTHYDPRWVRQKAREKPFDLNVAFDVVGAMAEAGLNMLIVDCADGVKYKSHPELARRYTVPMRQLKRLVERANKLGIEVMPKLNFAQSHYHQHNHWFRPHFWLFDNDEYWERAFRLIDELIEACRPPRFFHIGMDEDHNRSHRQYAAAICRLAEGLRDRGLRAVMWKDAQTYPGGEVHKEKSRAAEGKIPRDVVQLIWNYHTVLTGEVRRLCRKGFELWGAPGHDPEQVQAWRDALIRYGGKGIVLTNWIPCRPGNRSKMLKLIRTCGPVCSGVE